MQAVVTFVPSVVPLADIGCDHAVMACAAVVQRGVSRAIGIDKRPGALAQGQRTIARAGLKDRVELRLGDGLSPLQAGEVATVVAAGMGGRTILDILEPERLRVLGIGTLVLQPNRDEVRVRRMLCTSGWRLADESLPDGRTRCFPTMLFQRGVGPRLTELEALLGPHVLRKRPPAFGRLIRRWLAELTSKPDADRRLVAVLRELDEET